MMNVLDFFQKRVHKHIRKILHKIIKETDIWENYVIGCFKTKIKFHGTAEN